MGEGEVSKSEMKAEYKKEPGKKYLVISPESPEKEFAVQMLSENKIPGLLSFEKRIFNGDTGFFYDVSGKHALQDNLEPLLLSGKKISGLLQSLYCVSGSIGSYFLEIQGIILDVEYIFEDEQGMYFCYNPSSEVKEEQVLETFATRLLEIIDHDDDMAVELGYGFYKMVKQGDKAILQILEEILSEGVPVDEIEEKRENRIEVEEDIWMTEEDVEEKCDMWEIFFQKKPDRETLICFVVLLVVSLGYLGYLLCLSQEMSLAGVTGSNSSITAIVFVVLSVLGMTAAFVDIDIKGKR